MRKKTLSGPNTHIGNFLAAPKFNSRLQSRKTSLTQQLFLLTKVYDTDIPVLVLQQLKFYLDY